MAREVKCNFNALFAKIDEANELKEIAQSIVNQAKEAYEKRFAELSQATDCTVEFTAEEPSQDEQVAEEPKKKARGKKSVASAAKEVAERMKKEAKEAKPVKAEKAEKKTKASKKDDKIETISITDKAAIKKLGLTFEKYNDKCWVIRGNSKPLKEVLMGERFKGVYNSMLKGGGGMVIRNAVAQECADALGFKVKVN